MLLGDLKALPVSHPDLIWLYLHAKEWQSALGTVIGAGVGFTGVILTLLFNARLARRAERRRSEANLANDLRRRDEEANALRRALRVEHQKFLEGINWRIEQVKKAKPSEDIRIPIPSRLILTESSLDKIGLLTEDQANQTIGLYGTRPHLMTHMLDLSIRSDRVLSDDYIFVAIKQENKSKLLHHLTNTQTAATASVDALKTQIEGAQASR